MTDEKKIKMMRNETKYIVKVLEKVEDEGLKNRFANVIIWYMFKAKRNKILYYTLSIMTLLLTSVITWINVCVSSEYNIRCITVVLSILVTLAVGINTLFRFHSNWTRYRRSAEEGKVLAGKLSFEYEINAFDASKKAKYMSAINELACDEIEEWNIIRNLDSA